MLYSTLKLQNSIVTGRRVQSGNLKFLVTSSSRSSINQIIPDINYRNNVRQSNIPANNYCNNVRQSIIH